MFWIKPYRLWALGFLIAADPFFFPKYHSGGRRLEDVRRRVVEQRNFVRPVDRRLQQYDVVDAIGVDNAVRQRIRHRCDASGSCQGNAQHSLRSSVESTDQKAELMAA